MPSSFAGPKPPFDLTRRSLQSGGPLLRNSVVFGAVRKRQSKAYANTQTEAVKYRDVFLPVARIGFAFFNERIGDLAAAEILSRWLINTVVVP